MPVGREIIRELSLDRGRVKDGDPFIAVGVAAHALLFGDIMRRFARDDRGYAFAAAVAGADDLTALRLRVRRGMAALAEGFEVHPLGDVDIRHVDAAVFVSFYLF